MSELLTMLRRVFWIYFTAFIGALITHSVLEGVIFFPFELAQLSMRRN